MCSMWSSARGGWWLPWSSPNTCLRAVQCPGREPLRNCQHQVLHQSDLDDGGWGQDHHNLAVSCFDMILPQSAQSVSWEVSLVHSWRQRGTFKFLPNKDQEELPAHKYIPVQGSLVQRGQYHQGRHDQVKLVPELSLHPHTGDNHGSLSLLSTKVRIVRDCAGAIGMGLAMGLMGSTAARYRHRLCHSALGLDLGGRMEGGGEVGLFQECLFGYTPAAAPSPGGCTPSTSTAPWSPCWPTSSLQCLLLAWQLSSTPPSHGQPWSAGRSPPPSSPSW